MSAGEIRLRPHGIAARAAVPGALCCVRRRIVASLRTMRCFGSRDHSAAVRSMRPSGRGALVAMHRLSAACDRPRESPIPLRRPPCSNDPRPEIRGLAGPVEAAGCGHGEGGTSRGGMHRVGTPFSEAAGRSWIRSGRSSGARARSAPPAPRREALAEDSRDALPGESVGARPAEGAPGRFHPRWAGASLGPARGRRADDWSHGGLVRRGLEKGWRGSCLGGDRSTIPPRSGPGALLRYNRPGLSSGSVVARGVVPR